MDEAVLVIFNALHEKAYGEPAFAPDASGDLKPTKTARYIQATRRLADRMPLSKSDVAALLGVSTRTVDRLRDRGLLTASGTGSRVVFEAGSVEAYSRSRQRAGVR